MRLLLFSALALLFLIGCASETDAARAPSAAAEAAPAADTSFADLPPSRAGDVAPAEDYEAALTDILQQVVTETGLVRYDLLRREASAPGARGELNEKFRRVLKAVETYDAGDLDTQAEKLSFWMNAYNVQMLQNIIATPEAEHIEQGGYADAFFKTPFRTAGHAVTLDEIENVILRKEDGPEALKSLKANALDPRIHVGLNCAAASCPRLRSRAFTPQNVDAELNAAMRDFTASPAHFRAVEGGFVLSSLLDWFGEDFDRAGEPAGDYLLGFMPEGRLHYDALRKLLQGRSSEEIKARPNVTFAYDWTVNRAR